MNQTAIDQGHRQLDEWARNLPPMWTLWSGGENPAPGESVTVLLRSSLEVTRSSDRFEWLHSPSRTDAGDIMGYRVVEKPGHE